MIETFNIRSFRLCGLTKRGLSAVVSTVNTAIRRTKLPSRLRMNAFIHPCPPPLLFSSFMIVRWE